MLTHPANINTICIPVNTISSFLGNTNCNKIKSMDIGSKIKKARNSKGLSQAALAEACGWGGDGKQGRISHYEKNRREPSLADLRTISTALNIKASSLIDNDEIPSKPTRNTAEAPLIKGFIPLIAWVKAGTWEDAIELYSPSDESAHPTTVNHSKNTFALKVDGDSMTAPVGAPGHSFPHGIIIYVDPDQRADTRAGDYVVAKQLYDNQATFKQLASEEGRPVLKPLNTGGQYVIIRDEFEVIGKVIDAGWGGL